MAEPTITRKILYQYILGAHAVSIGADKDFDMDKVMKSKQFTDELIQFLDDQNLLNEKIKPQ